MTARGSPVTGTRWPWVVASGSLVAVLLAVVQLRVEGPMLLAERFVPGSGWIEIAALALYGAALAWGMAEPRRSARLRVAAWRLFSLVFFGQLALGLAGVDRCLMSGRLHLPIPAMILAGPLYRGHPGFMVWLLLSTIVLMGPAWCSHLCYLGSWDDLAARRRKRPRPLPPSRPWIQAGVLAGVIAAALGAGRAGVGAAEATALGMAFGAGGLVVMATLSRRTGAMVHCTAWCPIGLITTLLGRLSPFRIRLDDTCDRCGACTAACRYDALNAPAIEGRRVARSCTLCGDCVRTCPHGSIRYAFPGLGPHPSRMLFITLVTAMQAITLGLARI